MNNGRCKTGCVSRPAHESGFFVSRLGKLKHGLLALLLALTLLGGSALGAVAQTTTTVSGPVLTEQQEAQLSAAVTWLEAQQDSSGAFLGMSGDPDPGTTVDAVLALLASPSADSLAIQNAIDYLRTNADSYTELGAGQAAKLVLAFVAADADLSIISGDNPIDLVEQGIDAETGLCGFGMFDHSYCLLAEMAVRGAVPAEWIDAARAMQAPNGGWGYMPVADDASADSNTTALAIQALIAAGVAPDDDMIVHALDYLTTTIAPGGGFAYSAIPFAMDPPELDANGTPIPAELVADANSTAVVIQALIAAGVDLDAPEWGNPLAALASFQNESGGFRYMDSMPDDNLFATVQAIPALAGQTLALPVSSR